MALHFMFYDFCKIHSTLRVIPAMEAGIDDHVWSLAKLEEIAHLADWRGNYDHAQSNL
jgi:hypothetical protein